MFSKLMAIVWSAIFLASCSFAQDLPEYEWVRSLEGGVNAFDAFRDVYALERGGFVAAGYANSRDGATRATSIIAKFSEAGEIEWSHQYSPGWFNTIIELDNHDLIVGGPGGEFDQGDYWFEARRVDSDGEPIWQRRYGHGLIYAVIELKNGDLLFGGTLFDQDNRLDAALIRVNLNGNVIWSRTYREDGQPTPFSGVTGLRETEDGVIAGGFVNANGEGHGGFGGSFIDFLVIKVNLAGERLWSNRLHCEPNTYNYGTGLTSCRAGGFILSGELNGVEHEGLGQAEIIKLNDDGEQQWVNRFNRIEPGGPLEYRQEGTGIFRQRNGEFVICGVQNYVRANPRYGEGVLIKTNEGGEEQWRFLSRFYQLDGFVRGVAGFNSIVQARDHGLVACGYAMREGTGQDAVIVKLTTEAPGAVLFYFLPEDTLLSVLPGDSIGFVLRARNRRGEELDRDWYFNGILFAQADTFQVVQFDSIAQDTITCRFNDHDWTNQVQWYVSVTDLYVHSYTPDTLALTVRRGESIDFSLDTVRAVEGDRVEYLWLKRNMDIGDEIDTAGTESRATVPFLQSGHYRIDGMAYRGESSDVVSWDVSVRGAIWAFAPEDLVFEVLPDSTVSFIVEPTFPDAEGQRVQWLIDGELAAEDTTLFNWSFGEADSCPPHLVQVVVTDTVEADTVTWTVMVVEPDFVSDKRDAYPTRAELLTVSPNPFNSTLTIRYQSVQSVQSVVNIFDISGRLVVDFSETTPPYSPPSIEGGICALIWDATLIPAGVYFVRLQSGSQVVTKKVVLMR